MDQPLKLAPYLFHARMQSGCELGMLAPRRFPETGFHERHPMLKCGMQLAHVAQVMSLAFMQFRLPSPAPLGPMPANVFEFLRFRAELVGLLLVSRDPPRQFDECPVGFIQRFD